MLKKLFKTSSTSNLVQDRVKTIEINCQNDVHSVEFLAGGKHIVSGGKGGIIRRWRVEDGVEIVPPMEVESDICNIAVSRDEKWIVSGTYRCGVVVWNAENHKKFAELKVHTDNWVYPVDISSDGTRIVTGSEDSTVCVWSLPTGNRLLGPLKHDSAVVAARFSPNGCLIATGTWDRKSVRIYDNQNGTLLIEWLIQVNSGLNKSLAWADNSKDLYALSADGNIRCFDVYAKTTLFQWPIHNNNKPRCICLARDGTFIAASSNSSISFWSAATHKQIGPLIDYAAEIGHMAISPNHDIIVIGRTTSKKVLLRSLCDLLPHDRDHQTFPEQEIMHITEADQAHLGDIVESLRTKDLRSNEKIMDLEQTIQQLRSQLSESHQKESSLNETVDSLRADLRARTETAGDLEKITREYCDQLTMLQHAADREKDNFNETIKNSDRKIAQLEETVQELRIQLAHTKKNANSLTWIMQAHELKCRCEAFYARGCIQDASGVLLEMLDLVRDDQKVNALFTDWYMEFTSRCITTLEDIGDKALSSGKRDEAIVAYSAALMFGTSTRKTVLIKWVNTVLSCGSGQEALHAGSKFKDIKSDIFQLICDTLEGNGRITEAIECFREIHSEPADNVGTYDENSQWKYNFRQRCIEKLVILGNAAMNSKDHKIAVKWYSDALALDPLENLSDVLVKRSNAQTLIGVWEDALKDANKVIDLNPSFHGGYERRHAALHGMGCYRESFEAFKVMLSKLEQSTDTQVRELHNQYVDATLAIEDVIEQTIRSMPSVVIDTKTGRLCGKAQQAAAFKEFPVHDELLSSMTTSIDHPRIQSAVKTFYRYVMLSHRWQPDEPTFQIIGHSSVYALPASPANSKLKNFCKLACSLNFKWAWSDTCCVDQIDLRVQHESLVAMFRWYQGSSLTVVHLLGVLSESQEYGCLSKSIWNTCGWTYQEYIASDIVQFFTEDWKPYLGLEVLNHKMSPEVLSEMEHAMKFSTQELASLHPGLDRVREKLYLASGRKTTREEDIAYSLFGIFNAAIPVMYGEGNRAIGRFLEYVLMGSKDVTILAWTGTSGGYNSCLPMDLTVYNQIVPSQIPQKMEAAELDHIVKELRSSQFDFSPFIQLYNKLNNDSRALSMNATRLQLPGILFRVTKLVFNEPEQNSTSDLRVYRATAHLLRGVEIKTSDKLTEISNLFLVHPWIRPLLDQESSQEEMSSDTTTQALRFFTRLRQPFGALLFSPYTARVVKRVATDSLINAQVREELSVSELIDNIQTIEVL